MIKARDIQGQVVQYTGGRDDEEFPHGDGQGVFDSGFEYQGQWKNGLMHGVGTHTNPYNQEVYQGQFENGMRHGRGRFTAREIVNPDDEKPSTVIYTGSWSRGKKEGIFRVEQDGSSPDVVIYKSGTKLTKNSVDRGMRCCEKCVFFMQILSFGLFYIAFPIVFYLYNHTRHMPTYIPLFMFGGFFLIATICAAQCGYDSTRSYVSN